jgi:hypothetical protein
MSVRRATGCLLLLVGIAMAGIPFFVSVPNDNHFLALLEGHNEPGAWTRGGTGYVSSTTYTFEIEQKVGINESGEIISLEATLQAKDSSGHTRIYRRTRYFDEYGARAETVLETPTRTMKKGRGQSGKDQYQETVLSDNSAFLARPLILRTVQVIGGVLVLAGTVLLLISSVKNRRTRVA